MQRFWSMPKSVLTPMRNYNIYFSSCMHSALTARLSHLLNHCNEKLHFSWFWNGSSDLWRFLFHDLCYTIQFLVRPLKHLSYCMQSTGRTRGHGYAASVRSLQCRVARLFTIRVVLLKISARADCRTWKMAVEFMSSRLDGWQTDTQEVHYSSTAESLW